MQKDKTELEVTRMTKEKDAVYGCLFCRMQTVIRLITTTLRKNSVRSSMRLQHTNFP